MTATLAAAAKSMQGVLHGEDRGYSGVSTDTRTLETGQLFFALSGPNFDGSDFVGTARGRGAAGAVVHALVDEDIAQITVDDTKLALGRLGRSWRDRHNATVVGITGSNGKTTLKELTAACLAQRAPTLATEGNLNNDIGMPLMLMRMDESHRFAVLEMGANHIGEIAYLTSVARPDIVAITNAGAAHLEGFGSIEGVARGKGEILQGESRPTHAILNADDKYFDYWRSLVSDIEVTSFGLSDTADVYGDDIVVEGGRTQLLLHIHDESVPVSLALSGIHNVRNACAAAAIATAAGVGSREIAAALESVEPVSGRLQPIAGRNGATVYDDSYNANPLSVVAAGEFLASLTGESWFVLGDMKELGADEARLHAEVGEKLKSAGIDRLFATGDLCRNTVDAFGDHAAWFADTNELAADVRAQLSNSVNVLVKGSRSMRMERVVDAVRAEA
jgi:UDP-N-acetylmuramoyl-tripeptide--D-alanyl-D-alanine ligase